MKKLSNEERKKVELWAEGTKQIEQLAYTEDITFFAKIVRNNETVPAILVNHENKISAWRNLDLPNKADEFKLNFESLSEESRQFLEKERESMSRSHDSIEIYLSKDERNYIYYADSNILAQLYYYPYIQLGVIFLFILVSYIAFSSSRKAEQNQVWVGLSKETAHQLGTPISSLIAWVELLKLDDKNKDVAWEVEKDVKRLETITERFSKIGSAPVLSPTNILTVIENAVSYMKNRTSSRVGFSIHFPEEEEIMVPINIPLFEWVIENLCKNAVDAMSGEGKIEIHVADHFQIVYIDVADTGKGIPKSKYKTIFQPGYTTKKRGWGLGLSLTKRIIETYHQGKIFVKNSEINNGTTFRIALKK